MLTTSFGYISDVSENVSKVQELCLVMIEQSSRIVLWTWYSCNLDLCSTQFNSSSVLGLNSSHKYKLTNPLNAF